CILITVIGLGAGLLLTSGGGDDEPPTPTAPAVVEQTATASLEPMADAMFWVGGCSVACSLIWGSCIVYTAKLKRGGGQHHEPYR
ncbi:MAG: hypothetical protein ACPGES_11140, partial [Coraliomargarita sp.]